jgi:hypothetical protein
VVHVYFQIGRHTVKAGHDTMTVHRGRLSALLGFKTARTIDFRYQTSGSVTLQVEIQTRIAQGHGTAGRRPG